MKITSQLHAGVIIFVTASISYRTNAKTNWFRWTSRCRWSRRSSTNRSMRMPAAPYLWRRSRPGIERTSSHKCTSHWWFCWWCSCSSSCPVRTWSFSMQSICSLRLAATLAKASMSTVQCSCWLWFGFWCQSLRLCEYILFVFTKYTLFLHYTAKGFRKKSDAAS